MATPRSAAGTGVELAPYVPRLLVRWWADVPGPGSRVAEGTLVSADISGFTNLSERLAGLGRQGAEELTEVINECFDAMITICDAEQGDVVKFGGDALLVLFEGPDHAARACAAAVGMRESIRRPLVAPSAGRVRLRMSVGVHSGRFPLLVVRGGHHELLIAGPDVTETVQCEADAEAGQILLGAATAALLDPGCLGAAVGERRLLRRAPRREPTIDLTASSEGTVDLAPLVPDAQRDQIAAGAPGEHRQVAIAFVKFSGTDRIVGDEGPDGLGERLRALAAEVGAAAERHGVHWLASDVYPDGGKVILTAGAPTSAGDDEDRMLRAVRDILDSGVDLPLRAGVNTGLVFAGDLGGRTRRVFTVMGDAVNLAARLMQKAGEGELIAAQAVLDRATTRFATTPMEPFLVKGKSQPISAAAVGAPGEAIARAHRQVPLVGRHRELATLLGLVADAERGRGSVARVVGDPGIGKTRLADEVARRSGLPVYTAWCQPYTASTPYAAAQLLLREVAGIPATADPATAEAQLRAWVAVVAPDLLEETPLLAVAFGAEVRDTPATASIDPRFRRDRTHDAVARLATTALATPVVVRLEDVQWLDPASGALMAHLLGELGTLPWVVVATSVGDVAVLDAVATDARVDVEVGPLDADAAGALVRAVAGDGADDDVIEQVVERSGGHPLFVIELVEAVCDGSLTAIPDSVERLLTTRLDTLPASDRLLLREASVLGLRFDLDLAAAALGDHAGRPARWAGLGQFVVDEGNGWVRFRHGLVHRVAYDGLAFRRRRDVHRSAAHAVELRAAPSPEDEAELLSLHFHHAQDHAASWHYSRAAGERARQKYATVEAAELFDRALTAASRLPQVAPADVAAVAESLGDALELSGRFDRAAAAYAQARRMVAAAEHQARLVRKSGVLRERAGQYTDALRWYGRGLTLVRRAGGSPMAEADLAIAYAGVRHRQGKTRELVRWAERALDRAVAAGDRRAEAHALYLLHLSQASQGRRDNGHGWRAVEILEQLGDLVGLGNALNNLGIEAYYAGAWGDALDLYRRSAEARRRAGDVVGAATADNNIGEILSDQGHLDEAASLYRRSRRAFERAAYPVGVAVVVANEGRLAARAGRHDEAAGLLADALERFEAIGAGGFVVEVMTRQVEALLASGRRQDARTRLEAVAAARERHGGDAPTAAAIARLEGWCRLLAGDDAGAARAADEAVAAARALDAAFLEALALRLRAAVSGQPDGADAERAARLLADLGVISVVDPA